MHMGDGLCLKGYGTMRINGKMSLEVMLSTHTWQLHEKLTFYTTNAILSPTFVVVNLRILPRVECGRERPVLNVVQLIWTDLSSNVYFVNEFRPSFYFEGFFLNDLFAELRILVDYFMFVKWGR